MAGMKMTREDIISLCRLCLGKNMVSVDIFENGSEFRHLYTKIVACLPVQVFPNDTLPHKICEVCNAKVDDFYQFWTCTAKNQNQLNEWLQTALDQSTDAPKIKVEAEDTRGNDEFDDYEDGTRGDDDSDDEDIEAPVQKRIKTQHSDDEDTKPTNLVNSVDKSSDINDKKEGSRKKSKDQSNVKVENKDLPVQRTSNTNTKIENLDLPVRRTCRICKGVLENLTALRKHMRSVHPGELNYPCRLCDISLSNKYQKYKHYRAVHNGLPYIPSFTCSICKKTFKDKEFYEDHLSLHEGKKRHVCDLCNATFVNFFNLRTHRNTHFPQPKKSYSCSKCDMNFLSRSAYGYHKYKVHDKKNWQCPTCGKILAAYDRNHLRIHEKEQKYVCDICGKRFNCPQYLKDHRMAHDSVKPFKCYFCERRFTQRTPRSIHMRKFHTGETRYECNACNIRFVTKILLRKHIINQHKL